MSQKTLTFIVIAWLVIAAGPSTLASNNFITSVDNEPLTLQAAVDTALTNNQSLAQMQMQVYALEAVPSQAGALPDPTLGLNALNLPTDTFNFDQEPMTQLQVSLSQSFPFPGKRGLKREAAEYEASAAVQQVFDKRLQLTANVRSNWWRLAYLDRAIEIIKQNQSLMRDFVEIAQIKYEVGKGLQQDVLLAQLELSRLLNRELPLRSLRDTSAAELNALMDHRSTTPIALATLPENIDLPALLPEPVMLDRALAARPLLEVQREQMEAARIRRDLAKKDYYPDFVAGVGYGFRDAIDPTGRVLPDLATFRISVNLPIYSGSKQSKAVDQRSSEYFKSKSAYNDTLRSVQSGISKHYAMYHAARDQVSLYGSAIIPQAQQTVSAMLSGYQVNEVDFLNVLNAQLTLYNAQISYWEALSNAKQSLANLAAAVGTENLYE